MQIQRCVQSLRYQHLLRWESANERYDASPILIIGRVGLTEAVLLLHVVSMSLQRMVYAATKQEIIQQAPADGILPEASSALSRANLQDGQK
jgi:hypothetical protein